MDTLVKTKNTADELNLKIQAHLEELAKATDKARVSEEMVHYLEFCAKFHQYSASNIWMILLTRPDATRVAGFNAWKKMGRYVKRGEKGIPILAPMIYREDTDDEESEKVITGFRVVYVFDIAQTDGQPIPETPNWKSPEKNLELQMKLMEFAKHNGIKVTIEELQGEIQGISQGGSIVLSPKAGTKTLIHEIAHELLHQVKGIQLSRAEKEMEAESVAYLVAKHFGLSGLKSPNYIALHGNEAQDILICMSKITDKARQLIEFVEEEIRP